MNSMLQKCVGSFKSILASDDFGSDYEYLCTQLQIEWLRFRLWGESYGLQLNIDSGSLLNLDVFGRPDVQSTVDQTITNITYILTEIEELRKKYEAKPRLQPKNQDPKDVTSSRLSRPVSDLRQRIRENQKQKSIITIAKWSLGDVKRFSQKVNNVKVLIDGLESIAPAPTPRTPPIIPEERPPSYSEVERARRQTIQNIVLNSDHSTEFRSDTTILEHYQAFKLFLAGLPPITTQRRDKMMRLTNPQFKELRCDVYDDLIRRQDQRLSIPPLPPIPNYHPKRNQARRGLSDLRPCRYQQLVTDVIDEMERRFAHLETEHGPFLHHATSGSSTNAIGTARTQDPPPLLRPRSMQVSSAGPPDLGTTNWSSTVLGQVSGPTLAAYHSRFSAKRNTGAPVTTVNALQLPTSTFSTTAYPTRTLTTTTSTSTDTVEIFKSFRVAMDDPCSKVLPAAMKKYHINESPDEYALYIVYDNTERRMEMDEKPLLVFKKLSRGGKRPMFMLRKVPRTE